MVAECFGLNNEGVEMKSLFFAVAVAFATVAVAQEGTKSVLVNAPTPASNEASSSVATAAPAVSSAVSQCCEPAKLVKLAPWQVRRLNRVAERQEAREAKKCCRSDKSDNCKCECRKPSAVVVESR